MKKRARLLLREAACHADELLHPRIRKQMDLEMAGRALRRTLLELGVSQDVADELVDKGQKGEGKKGGRKGEKKGKGMRGGAQLPRIRQVPRRLAPARSCTVTVGGDVKRWKPSFTTISSCVYVTVVEAYYAGASQDYLNTGRGRDAV